MLHLPAVEYSQLPFHSEPRELPISPTKRHHHSSCTVLYSGTLSYEYVVTPRGPSETCSGSRPCFLYLGHKSAMGVYTGTMKTNPLPKMTTISAYTHTVYTYKLRHSSRERLQQARTEFTKAGRPPGMTWSMLDTSFVRPRPEWQGK